VLSWAFSATALGACAGGAQPGGKPVDPNTGNTMQPAVVTRVDYEEALRSAAIKLTGNLPTLAEIKQVRDVPESMRQAEYEKRIDDYMSRPSFSAQLIDFFRDTFKLAGTGERGGSMVNMDYAPTYAAKLVVEEKPFTDVVTASRDTCQSFDEKTGTFTAQSCPNQAAVGVLTDAGVQAQFFSSMAFRRVRWVQETFICRKFPAETAGTPQPRPGGSYTSPWDPNSITGKVNKKDARIDFQDDKSIVCANCHTTMNHIAPLFARFGANGALNMGIQVKVPIPNEPTASLIDWLPSGEPTAWRAGQPAADIQALGAAIAADPEFGKCITSRVWNWALSRPDVVEDGALLTDELAGKLVAELKGSGWNVKKLVRKAFTSDSFVRY
jgi:hypothetical protein